MSTIEINVTPSARPTRERIRTSLACPTCGTQQSKVIDSRITRKGTATRRRRECSECGNRFTTWERVEREDPAIDRARREAIIPENASD